MIELVLLRPTQVHNPNGKLIGSAVFAQLTAEYRRVHWRHLANRIEILHIGAICQIRLNSCFLRPTRVNNPNRKSIGAAVSAQLTAESPYTIQWANLSPKIALSHGGSGPPSQSWLLGPFQDHNHKGTTISSAIFAQVTAECPYT